jgi:hypothetical protein
MDGGDRAGYKQISKNCECTLITSTMGAVSGDWYGFEVISTWAHIAAITAPGMANANKLTSAKYLLNKTWIGAPSITSIKISTKTTGQKVLAYKRILL